MSDTTATYSFLPWLRQGLANQIAAGPGAGSRAEIDVALQLKGRIIAGGEQQTPLNQRVRLFGPGDILGVDARAIFRVEPRNWTSNYEPNYLPSIEFYAEDFPWRYTPAAPTGGRLMPWLALVVLEDQTEFKEGEDVRNRPLPYIEIEDPAVFPPAAQLWAWAHVHVNRSLAANDAEFVSTDMAAVLPRLQSVLNENPDLAYSRIISPRKLGENKAYHAFLMPAFESGRRACLGRDPDDPALADPLASAWGNDPNRPEPTLYPFYYRWWFRTGGPGDFESLVRLLKPQPADHRVGRRDIDVMDPGSNVDGVQAGRPDLGGILKLGGALRVPERNFTDPNELAELQRYENWATPYPQPIQNDIAAFVNLADDYDGKTAADANLAAGRTDPQNPAAGDPDPLVTAPLYGRWHAMTKRLLADRNGASLPNRSNWVHELNLDPRFRATAAVGTKIVQDHQEKYMDAAWSQLGRVLEANRRIRRGQVARDVSVVWHQRHIGPLTASKRQAALMLMAPMNRRVLLDGVTVYQRWRDSRVQPALTSAVFRRMIRPRARLMRSLPFDEQRPADALLDRVNDGEVSPAPPRTRPPGIVTPGDAGNAIEPKDAPPFVVDLIRRFPWLRWLLLLLGLLLILLVLLLVGPIAAAATVIVAIVAAIFFLFRLLSRWTTAVHAADVLGDETPPPASVDDIPRSPDFVITDIGSGFTPTVGGGTDSVEATNFKTALKDVYTLFDISIKAGQTPPKRPVDLKGVTEGMFGAINPLVTIPRRVMAGIVLPPRIRFEIGEQFVEAMAYPEFDTPMYAPLKELSKDLFLPNINYIAQNSVTLLEANQKFIEAYMVGLNHEFARELLWREYPTDQRGSYFRQFWDVSGYLDTEGLDPEALKEKLRDIPRLDRWPAASALGTHDHRDEGGAQESEVVLVIRGELLKRYPTAVIYAQHAVWFTTSEGAIVRRLDELAPGEENAPPKSKLRSPLYEAKVDPDIYFFGFDLTAEEARGSTGAPGEGDAGWFFVIKERPGEPRFGLDIEAPSTLNVWNDLSWPTVQPGAPGSFIDVTNPNAIALVEPPATDVRLVQYQDDVHVEWRSTMSAADVAYILFQVPVLVAIHAKEMLVA